MNTGKTHFSGIEKIVMQGKSNFKPMFSIRDLIQSVFKRGSLEHIYKWFFLFILTKEIILSEK